MAAFVLFHGLAQTHNDACSLLKESVKFNDITYLLNQGMLLAKMPLGALGLWAGLGQFLAGVILVPIEIAHHRI
jgi:hypothetical protein